MYFTGILVLLTLVGSPMCISRMHAFMGFCTQPSVCVELALLYTLTFAYLLCVTASAGREKHDQAVSLSSTTTAQLGAAVFFCMPKRLRSL